MRTGVRLFSSNLEAKPGTFVVGPGSDSFARDAHFRHSGKKAAGPPWGKAGDAVDPSVGVGEDFEGAAHAAVRDRASEGGQGLVAAGGVEAPGVAHGENEARRRA